MTDILERLEQLAHPKVGGGIALDVGLGTVAEAHSAFISKTCAEAISEIRRLRGLANEVVDLANRTIDNSTRTFRQIKEELDGKSS